MTPVLVTQGDGPIVLGQPHGGTFVPDDIFSRLNPRGQGLDDTDWHITRLYDGLLDDVTTVAATFHRYVVDANRDPMGASLYPGQNTTTLCPLTDFDGNPIWKDGQTPSMDEIDHRRSAFHKPYHDALAEELERVRGRHGFAILFDCHSIRSNIPFLFEGTLPVFNVGTNNGQTCDPSLEAATTGVLRNSTDYDFVINGRFKGGWTTRHYGRPLNNTHAIQVELAQRAYMDEYSPWDYAPDRANNLRTHLSEILQRLSDVARSGLLLPSGA